MNVALAVNEAALHLVCSRVTVEAGTEALAGAVSDALGVPARLSLIDGNWYRPGSLIDKDGRRIADDLEGWALEQSGGDPAALHARFRDAEYCTTQIVGRTFYLTAPLGPAPMDFIQVAIEEVQEIESGPLFPDDAVPDILDDLVARKTLPETRRPLSAARYNLRHVRNFPELLDGLTCEHRGDPRFKRFLAEWGQSSASRSGHFCDRWILSIKPYKSEDGEHLLEARPVPVTAVAFPDLAQQRITAVDYDPATAARAIDAQAGYRMAWYFLAVACHYAPYRCVADICDHLRDHAESGAGLTDADMQLMDNWVADPYNFH